MDVNVDAAGASGETALMKAAAKGRAAAARLLLRHGVRVDLKDRCDWPALHWAAHCAEPGAAEVIEALLAG